MWIFYHLVEDARTNWMIQLPVASKLFSWQFASAFITFGILQKWNQIYIWPQLFVIPGPVLKGYVHPVRSSLSTFASNLYPRSHERNEKQGWRKELQKMETTKSFKKNSWRVQRSCQHQDFGMWSQVSGLIILISFARNVRKLTDFWLCHETLANFAFCVHVTLTMLCYSIAVRCYYRI